MGIRFSLGGGFSAGRSGLRANTRNFGVGASGVRVNAGPVRVWVPGARRASAQPFTPEEQVIATKIIAEQRAESWRLLRSPWFWGLTGVVWVATLYPQITAYVIVYGGLVGWVTLKTKDRLTGK